MTEEHKGLPVHGYQPQSDAKVALVNSFKEMEERLLRQIEVIPTGDARGDVNALLPQCDGRLLAMGKSYAQIAFMLLNRAVFQPQRIRLPEDEPTLDEALERSDLP